MRLKNTEYHRTIYYIFGGNSIFIEKVFGQLSCINELIHNVLDNGYVTSNVLSKTAIEIFQLVTLAL